MATRTVVSNGGVPTSANNKPDLANKNKRMAYNMYRGMLTQFNAQANAIIENLPPERVTFDQGVDRQILGMIEQSNHISGGAKRGANMSGEMGGGPGVPPPPPPPPPPPMPGPGAPMAGRPRPPQSSSLEPPAAIQVAMMGQSKDKKPFTYTPGGIDLSQIKSPRMARRICRNAASEGISGPPPGAPTSNGQQMPPPPTAVPVFPPPVAVQVLPPPPPPQPQHRPPPAPQQMRPPLPPQQVRPPPPPMQMRPPMPPPQMVGPPRPLAEVLMGSLPQYQQQQQQQPQMVQQRAPPPMRPVEVVRSAPSPTPPTPPPQMTPQSPLSPVPQQMRMEPMRSSPTPNAMSPPPTGSIYIPVVMQQPPPPPQMPQVQPASLVLNKTQGMPWMNSANQQQPPQSPMWTPPGNMSPGARVIPIQIEGRNSPLSFAPQQRQQQQPQQQQYQPQQYQQQQPQQYQQQPQQYQQQPQQYQQQPQQYQQQPQQYHQPQQYQQQGTGVRVIPIQIEGRAPSTPPATSHRVQSPGVGGGWASPGPADNPTQSRSFRVLQRITSYDEIEGEPQSAPVSHSGPPPPAPMQQMRKMQLTNDDKALMDRFKAQEMSNGFSALKKPTRHVEPAVEESEILYFVDEDSSLHTEADPRYRGAAIPSRAFKMLQTMTGPEGAAAGDSGYQAQAQRAPAQQQQARVTSELYVPPSEQEVQPEPRKYTGSAIPSRSFRMLQAMTGTNQDENGLAYSEVPAEAMYYPPQSPCPSPYSWYYPPEGGSGDPVWDNYVYAYVQNYGQYPPECYYQNGYESEHEYSGYSSTEEMGYYDPQQAAAYYAACQQQQESPAEDSENPAASTTDANSSDDSEDSETEVEDSDDDEQVEPKRSSSGAIQAIKSVPDVRIVTTDEDDESEPEEEEEPVKQENNQLGIKQLSIIYEESDQSDAESSRRWHRRSAPCTETEESSDGETEDECHTSAKEEEDDDDESTEEEEEDDEIEIVKSPVKLSASRSTLVEEVVQSESEEEESEEEEEAEEEKVIVKNPEVVTKEVIDEAEEDESEEDEEEEDQKKGLDKSKSLSKMIKKSSSKNLYAKSKLTAHVADEDDSSDEECDGGKLMNSSTVVEISKTDSSEIKEESEESEEESDDEAANATVTVRLPLRIKISPSSTNCGPVATLTVGNSEQVQSSDLKANAKVEEWMQRGDSSNQRGSPEVSICLSLPLRRNPAPPPENEDSHWEDDSSSTSIQTVRHRRASIASSIHSVATTQQVPTPPVDSDKERSDDYESPAPAASPPIKIEEPKLTRVSSQTVLQEKQEKTKKTSSACEKRAKRNKRRSSTEDDSGVTDLSRQISDSESEVGLDLMMLACQRAATHSRLFKLLQDAGVCSDDDEEEEDGDESASSDNQQKEAQDVVIVPVTKPEVKTKRDTLRLPLQAEIGDSSSLSSSEITSPASPTVAAKLVRELAKELSKKKGKKSKASRIHATALRIMKEDDNDPYDTGTTGSSASSDSGGTRPSPLQPQQPPHMPQYYPAYPPHMYGPHYYDYVDYYNSWGMMDPRDYAAVPARAYRVLTQPGAGPMDMTQFAKCPRIRAFAHSPIVPSQSSPTPTSQNNASAS